MLAYLRFPHRSLLAALVCAATLTPSLPAADLAGSYQWKPVRLGAGGFVTGLVIHPQDASVRYARTDVGNAYRWDAAESEWIPLVVRSGTTGLPAATAVSPSKSGVESIAVDPQNTNVVLLALPFKFSNDTGNASIIGSVYRSTDGGRSFVASNLSVKMAPNGSWRNKGECMGIDPINSQIAYFGSRENGLWKSSDGGLTWAQLTTGGAPAATANVIGIRFDRVSATASTVYAVVAGGGILKSTDSGANWTDVTTGTGIAGLPLNSTVDSLGNLYVVKSGTTKIWKMTRTGTWSELSPNFGSSGNQANGIAVDPANSSRLFAIGSGGCLSRSLDGGATWTHLGSFYNFANSLSWLPQKINANALRWRSNGGILFDSTGRLWSPQGNEGVLTTIPSATNTETSTAPPLWTIDSKGIEEFVTHDVLLLPGTNDSAVTAVEDATAFRLENPDTYTAVQANLQDQLISNATGLGYCPNDSNYVVAVTADVNNTGSGKDYSGYSTDGGKTWTQFASRPTGIKAGSIAVSRRQGWGVGSDHLVWYPLGNKPPYWSADGGATWTQATGFPLKTDGTFNNATGYWTFALKQRALIADPLTADRFYLNLTWGGLYRSDDGGRSWVQLPGTNLPGYGHHAQLAANPYVPSELWFVDGWEGASFHGLWRSVDGMTFTKMPGISNAITVAVGKGTGTTGAIYFYGKLTGDPDWGIFRSVDSGTTWDRISRYPTGMLDIPTCMAASQDTFGLLYVGFSGNSFLYGRPAGSTNLVINPGFEAAFGATGWKSWWNSTMSANPFSRDTTGGAPGGIYHGTISSTAAQYDVNVYQNFTGLPTGTYTIRALFKTGGTHTLLRVGAYNYDAAGSARWTNVTNANGVYRQFTVSDIQVSNGKTTLSIQAKSSTGGWVHFDQFEFIRD